MGKVHSHQTSGSARELGVDAATGRLETTCSACGATIEVSDELCQVCAIEASGGETASDPVSE